MSTLFKSVEVGSIGKLNNRFVMAAMTRARANNKEHLPTDLMKEYYNQRRSAGMILTEGVHISPGAIGWPDVPGIWTKDQVEAWKPITAKVQENNGARMVMQLWHQGRQSHESLVESDMGVVSASAIAADGECFTRDGKKPFPVPRALETSEIPAIVESYAVAAKNAIEAGFSGVEIHSANGYLVDQFLQSKTNVRSDQYGGSIENRIRFLDEVIQAILKNVDASKVGIKISPNGVFGSMGSPEFQELFDEVIQKCAHYKLAFIEVMDGLAFGFHKLGEPYTLERVHTMIKKVQGDQIVTRIIANCGYHTKEEAEKALEGGHCDAVSFGRPYIANPDLVERFQHDLKLNEEHDQSTWYAYEKDPAKGYTTFPTAEAST